MSCNLTNLQPQTGYMCRHTYAPLERGNYFYLKEYSVSYNHYNYKALYVGIYVIIINDREFFKIFNEKFYRIINSVEYSSTDIDQNFTVSLEAQDPMEEIRNLDKICFRNRNIKKILKHK